MLGGFTLGGRELGSARTGVLYTTLIVIMDGALETGRVSVNDFELNEVLNGRMTASMTFLEPRPSTWRPFVGSNVYVFVGPVRRFSGTVDTVQERHLVDHDSTYTSVEVHCLDYNLVPQRFFITSRATYTGKTAGFIVRDLVTTYLAGDGITIDGIEDGPTITTYDIADKSVAQVLDDLSDITGMIWSIGPYKVMEFRAAQFSTAPFSVTSSNSTARGVSSRASRDQYRNVQIIRGTSILVTRTDATEIAARQLAEGGSGRYERFENDSAILTTAQANAKGDGLLARYGQIDTEVMFETDIDGLRPGQRITLTFPDLNVSGTYLLTQVDWKSLASDRELNRYGCVANSGEVRVPWLTFWKKLMQGTPERSNF